jgi:hypothetical protein
MLNRLTREFFQAFYSPKSLYQEISRGRKSSSWLCVLIYCLIYTMGSLWLYFQGFTPFVKPWINLPEDIYYLVQAFYSLPLVFLMWILGRGVLHVLCGQFSGKGRFEVLLLMTGYSLWAPWYLLIVVDCIPSTPEWLYNAVLLVCIIFILIETSVAALVEEKINLIIAFASSVTSLFSIGLILFTYLR